MRLIMKWLVCLGALALARYCFPSLVSISGGAGGLLGAATVLWLINLLIKPVIQILSLPVTIVTLGIFSLVVNAGMVALADAILPVVTLGSFWMCLFIAAVVSAGNAVFARKSK